MDTTKLRYYVTAVQLGSYEAAGKALFVSAPAIARAVHELEHTYHVKLMQKSGTRATPTPIGRSFCDKAEEALRSMKDLETLTQTAARYEQRISTIKLAAAEFPFRGLIFPPTTFKQFESLHPDIPLSVIRRPSSVCLAALEGGVVDAAIVLGRVKHPDMISSKLFSIRLVAVASKEGPFSGRKAIFLEDLAIKDLARPHDLRCVYPLIDEAFRKRGIAPRYSELHPSEERHAEFLARGGVFFALPEPEIVALYPDAVFLPVHDADLSAPIHLVFFSERNCHDLDALKKVLVSNGGRLSQH